MSLSRTVSEINGDFSRKLLIFPTSRVNIPAEGIPLELGIGARVKNSSDWLPEGQKSFKIGLAACDGWADTTRRQRPVASVMDI